MARIRSVHPGFFTDENVVALPMAARLFLVGVWAECDDNGVFEWKPLTLKMKIFPADNVDAGALLQDLVGADAVRRFSHGGKDYGVARNFRKYQRPKNPSYRYELPEEQRNYVGLEKVSPPALPQPSPSPTEIPPQMEDGGGKREEEEKKKDGGGDARPLVSEQASSIANEVAVLCGHDLEFLPPAWMGAPMRVQTWLSEWPPEIILAGCREALARKRDGPPDSIRYFEKAIARFASQQSAPLPEVKIQPRETIHVAREDRSVIASQDKLIANLAVFDRPGPEPGTAELRSREGAHPVRLLSKG